MNAYEPTAPAIKHRNAGQDLIKWLAMINHNGHRSLALGVARNGRPIYRRAARLSAVLRSNCRQCGAHKTR
ncbi:hypothetical protein D3C81_991060 [compost metagenome]